MVLSVEIHSDTLVNEMISYVILFKKEKGWRWIDETKNDRILPNLEAGWCSIYVG